MDIGQEIYENQGLKTFTDVVDQVCALVALRMIDVDTKRELLPDNSDIGFSGRVIMSGRKQEYVLEGIVYQKINPDLYDRLISISSAL